MSHVRFPPRLLRGRIVRIQTPASVEVMLDLDFGVHVSRTVVLEGLNQSAIPPKLRNAAQHCLIVALGGKDVIVAVNDRRWDGPTIARLYLDERIAEASGPWMQAVPGTDALLLEVSSLMAHLATRNYEKAEVIRVLNGRREAVA